MLLALGLSASADSRTLAPPDLAKIRTVAIISALGQTFSFENVRPWTFEWMGPPKTRYLEISDWKIDDTITKDITSALAKRITVKPSKFREGDFSTWDYASLRQQIFLLNDDPNIDAYILVLRDWHWDAIGASGHDLQGLGLYRRDYTSGEKRYGLFASYRIAVVDANTGAVYASSAVTMPDGKLPWADAPATLWPSTPNDLTPAEQKALSDGVTKLIAATLPRALAEMKLTK
jgi:hypothetical protein